MTCGIYLLTNKINGKVYVGQSTDIEGRFSRYWGHGPDKKQTKIRRAFEKYGADAFTREILEVCELDVDVLNEAEVRWGLQLRAIEDGYNCQLGGRGNLIMSEDTRRKIGDSHRQRPGMADHMRKLSDSNRGRKHGAQTRRKLGYVAKKRWSDPEHRKKMADAIKDYWEGPDSRLKAAERQRGRKHTEETRRKIREAGTGKRRSEEAIRKTVESRFAGKGYGHTEESRRKISEAHSGKKKSEDHKRKIGEAHKGRKHSDEQKRRNRDAHRDHARDARIRADLAMGQSVAEIAFAEGMRTSSIRRILDSFKRDGVMVSHMLAASHRPMPVGPWHTIELFI